jgi:hypothetical protein
MIHALPGMGADRRMYPKPWSVLPDFRAHDWIRHAGERSVAEVASSMADAWGVRDGDVLVGSSLGGIVSCEITKIRHIPKLFLVGSAVRKEEVSRLLATLHPLAQYAPFEWLRVSAGSIPVELSQMFSGIEASFIRAMCAAVFDWDGGTGSQTQVYRIHGKHDLVIPAPPSVDLLLSGGHLISISHAQECATYIGANKSLQPTATAVTPPANAGDRASRSRG